MSRLIRYFSEDQTYFVTSVTHNRKRILLDNSDLFWSSLNRINTDNAFNLIAWVLLPDHFHLLIRPNKTDLSTIMKRLKLAFAYQYRNSRNLYRGKVWQKRFWDHVIRDQADFNRHLDYIHFNPVKHGLVSRPSEWEHTSFGEFLNNGLYLPDWGTHNQPVFEGDFGE